MSPPFTLNVTGIEPDIWYTVNVMDLTDNISTPTPCSSPPHFNCYMLIGTNYTFYPDSPSPCNKYSFIVIPVNGVGEGERSEAINITDTSGEYLLDGLTCFQQFVISQVEQHLSYVILIPAMQLHIISVY